MTNSSKNQVKEFMSELNTLFEQILGKRDKPYCDDTEFSNSDGSTHYGIYPFQGARIPLTIEGEVKLQLYFVYYYKPEANTDHLRITKSSILVFLANGSLVAGFDFMRSPRSNIPVSHINVHGENGDMTSLMLGSLRGSRAKARRKKYLKDGKFPTFSTLHFPTGGEFFRPTIEDVLQMLIFELDIDCERGWLEAIEQSRSTYRQAQFRSLVRTFPQIAYDELQQSCLALTPLSSTAVDKVTPSSAAVSSAASASSRPRPSRSESSRSTNVFHHF